MAKKRKRKTDKCGIYKWTNIITGQVLVGQTGSTKGFAERKAAYLRDLRKGEYGNTHFQRSFNKHGESVFVFEPIEFLPIGDLTIEQHKPILTAREQFWVDYYRAQPAGVYNQAGPVDSPSRGRQISPEQLEALKNREFTEEWRAKLSAASKGKPKSEEHIANYVKARKGKKIRAKTQEEKDKISRGNKGRPKSEEGRKNMSEAHKGVPWSPLRRQRYEEKKARKVAEVVAASANQESAA